MSTKRHNSSTPMSGAAKKPSRMTLTSYLDGCDEKPDIFFVAGEAGQLQVTFPAHTAKFQMLPDGSFLRGYGGMVSAEPVSLPSGVAADGFSNLMCALYGKDMALTEESWLSTFATYAALLMMDTDFEAQLLEFAERRMSPAMTPACLATCTGFAIPLYKSPFEELCWKRIDRDGDATFESPTFLDIEWSLLLRILERDSLHVSSEIVVYEAAVSWATESLKRKSEQCTHAAIRKELGEALFQIRFTHMPLEDFGAGPGEAEILTDKEELDIYRARFNKKITPQGFSVRKRVPVKKRNRLVVEGCTLCGRSEDVFIKCCEGYMRVRKRAWSKAYCQNEDCSAVAYRCECGAFNHEDDYVRATECEECGLGIHYCGDGVRPLSEFRMGERCEGCDESVPGSYDTDDE